ncbi:hypothetical protein IWX91DRAFT_127354 [Phyllosticta citricarpa]
MALLLFCGGWWIQRAVVWERVWPSVEQVAKVMSERGHRAYVSTYSTPLRPDDLPSLTVPTIVTGRHVLVHDQTTGCWAVPRTGRSLASSPIAPSLPRFLGEDLFGCGAPVVPSPGCGHWPRANR